MLKAIKDWFSAPQRLEEQKTLNDYLMKKVALLVEKELNKNLSKPPFYQVTVEGKGNILFIFREHEYRSRFAAYFILAGSRPTITMRMDDSPLTTYSFTGRQYGGDICKKLAYSRYYEGDSDYKGLLKHVRLTLIDLFDGFEVIEADPPDLRFITEN